MSAAINMAMSAGFFLLAFGGSPQIPVWGLGQFAFDFLPQGFAVGLMSTLVPGLLARRAIAGARLEGSSPAVPSAGSILRRSLVNALLAAAAGGALWLAVFWAAGIGMIAWTPAFVLKLLYGGLLGASATAFSLRAMWR